MKRATYTLYEDEDGAVYLQIELNDQAVSFVKGGSPIENRDVFVDRIEGRAKSTATSYFQTSSEDFSMDLELPDQVTELASGEVEFQPIPTTTLPEPDFSLQGN